MVVIAVLYVFMKPDKQGTLEDGSRPRLSTRDVNLETLLRCYSGNDREQLSRMRMTYADNAILSRVFNAIHYAQTGNFQKGNDLLFSLVEKCTNNDRTLKALSEETIVDISTCVTGLLATQFNSLTSARKEKLLNFCTDDRMEYVNGGKRAYENSGESAHKVSEKTSHNNKSTLKNAAHQNNRQIRLILRLLLRQKQIPESKEVTKEALKLATIIPINHQSKELWKDFLIKSTQELSKDCTFPFLSLEEIHSRAVYTSIQSLKELKTVVTKLNERRKKFTLPILQEAIARKRLRAEQGRTHRGAVLAADREIAQITLEMEKAIWQMTAAAESHPESFEINNYLAHSYSDLYESLERIGTNFAYTLDEIDEYYLFKGFKPPLLTRSLCVHLSRILTYSPSYWHGQSHAFLILSKILEIDYALGNDSLSTELKTFLKNLKHNWPIAYYGIACHYNKMTKQETPSMADHEAMVKILCTSAGIKGLSSSKASFSRENIPEGWFNLAFTVLPGRWESTLDVPEMHKIRHNEASNIIAIIKEAKLPEPVFPYQDLLYNESVNAFKLMTYAIAHRADCETALFGTISSQTKELFKELPPEGQYGSQIWSGKVINGHRLKKRIEDFQPNHIRSSKRDKFSLKNDLSPTTIIVIE